MLQVHRCNGDATTNRASTLWNDPYLIVDTNMTCQSFVKFKPFEKYKQFMSMDGSNLIQIIKISSLCFVKLFI